MKRRHPAFRAALGATALAATLSVSPATSHAQTVGRTGWALNRFESAPMGDVFFLAEHPWYSSTRRFSVGLYGDYAIDPLVAHVTTTTAAGSVSERDVNDVSGMFVMHLGAQVSFLDRIGVHVALPVSLSQSGEAAPASTASVGPADGPAVGDLRAGVRVRLFGHADRDAFSAHLGANVWLPIGTRVNLTGDEGVRVEPRLTLAGRGGLLRWSAGAGFLVRPSNDVINLAFGNELRFTGALGLTFDQDRLTIGPEGYVVTSLRDLSAAQGGGSATFAANQWGGELLLGVHYLVADKVLVGAGGGFGLEQGPGIPAGRVLFNVAYAPVTRVAAPVDTDGDGVFDPQDQCVTTPAGAHPDPARRGCPLIDTDSDGVFDNDDQCVTEPAGSSPDPARRGCPQRDRDGDGVSDADDACADTPQGPTPDPERRGCPDGDRDADGVLDHQDLCPDAPRMPFPDPARLGCSLPDADHDQVPEPPDACPGVPGVPSTDPARNGCPNADVQVDAGQIHIVEQVFFDTERDTIRHRSDRTLQAVAEVMRAATHIRRVSIEGHTDNRASDEHNLDLSQRRAAAVRRWLIEHGVDEGRLEAHGFGASRPIAPNTTAAGRARNRRVEFVITDPAQQAPAAGTPAVIAAPPSTSPPPDTRDTSHGHRGHHGRHGHH